MADEAAATTQNSGTDESSLLTQSTTPVADATTSQPKTEDTTQTSADADSKVAGEGEPKTEAEAPKPTGAPEKYEFTMPEGVTLDAKQVEAFEPVARELNLTQAQAQKLVDLQAAYIQQSVQTQIETWTNTRKGWVETVKADKEIGGSNLDANLTAAKKVVEKYGTPELRKALDDYGMGDHPEIVRMLSRIGKAMSEDKFLNGTPTTSVNPADVFFPTMIKK